jgi:hypothetical protein
MATPRVLAKLLALSTLIVAALADEEYDGTFQLRVGSRFLTARPVGTRPLATHRFSLVSVRPLGPVCHRRHCERHP